MEFEWGFWSWTIADDGELEDNTFSLFWPVKLSLFDSEGRLFWSLFWLSGNVGIVGGKLIGVAWSAICKFWFSEFDKTFSILGVVDSWLDDSEVTAWFEIAKLLELSGTSSCESFEENESGFTGLLELASFEVMPWSTKLLVWESSILIKVNCVSVVARNGFDAEGGYGSSSSSWTDLSEMFGIRSTLCVVEITEGWRTVVWPSFWTIISGLTYWPSFWLIISGFIFWPIISESTFWPSFWLLFWPSFWLLFWPIISGLIFWPLFWLLFWLIISGLIFWPIIPELTFWPSFWLLFWPSFWPIISRFSIWPSFWLLFWPIISWLIFWPIIPELKFWPSFWLLFWPSFCFLFWPIISGLTFWPLFWPFTPEFTFWPNVPAFSFWKSEGNIFTRSTISIWELSIPRKGGFVVEVSNAIGAICEKVLEDCSCSGVLLVTTISWFEPIETSVENWDSFPFWFLLASIFMFCSLISNGFVTSNSELGLISLTVWGTEFWDNADVILFSETKIGLFSLLPSISDVWLSDEVKIDKELEFCLCSFFSSIFCSSLLSSWISGLTRKPSDVETSGFELPRTKLATWSFGNGNLDSRFNGIFEPPFSPVNWDLSLSRLGLVDCDFEFGSLTWIPWKDAASKSGFGSPDKVSDKSESMTADWPFTCSAKLLMNWPCWPLGSRLSFTVPNWTLERSLSVKWQKNELN